jgi:hypothetical protein
MKTQQQKEWPFLKLLNDGTNGDTKSFSWKKKRKIEEKRRKNEECVNIFLLPREPDV